MSFFFAVRNRSYIPRHTYTLAGQFIRRNSTMAQPVTSAAQLEEGVTNSKTLQLPKKLIVLCDGTWKNADTGWEGKSVFSRGHPAIPSNITRMTRAILPEDERSHPQVVYYQAGVGSGYSVSDHLLGGGLAYGLTQNVREAYGFLVHNYLEARPNAGSGGRGAVRDQVYLLGFSRGAFTARSVGGMITSLGLLKKEAMQYFYYVFEDFENAGKGDYKLKLAEVIPGFKVDVPVRDAAKYLAAYKKALIEHGLTRDVVVDALAVYDTVGTLGLPVVPLLQRVGFPTTIKKYRFFDTGISDKVLNAFHALALDERRSAFQAAVWERAPGSTTNLKQVWFPGAHSNIGGGYEDSSISDLSMAWMMDQLSPFIAFNEAYLLQQVEQNKLHNFAHDDPPSTNKPSPSAAHITTHPSWQWGLGTIYNSLSWTAHVLMGVAHRTPGRYRATDYHSGRSLANLLANTNEYIHASARARTVTAGGGAAKGAAYKPKSLEGWELEVRKGEDGEQRAVWVYKGVDEKARGETIEEAPIGRFEQLLLDQDEEMKKRLFSEDRNGSS